MQVLESGVGELIQPPDIDGFREWNRTQKTRKLIDKRMTEGEAVERFVYDGCYIGTELYGTCRAPMSLAREVVRQGITGLRVAGQGVMELDLWLMAGIVKTLDLTYIGQEVFGVSAPLRREVESGRVEKVVEWSNAAISSIFIRSPSDSSRTGCFSNRATSSSDVNSSRVRRNSSGATR